MGEEATEFLEAWIYDRRINSTLREMEDGFYKQRIDRESRMNLESCEPIIGLGAEVIITMALTGYNNLFK